MKRKKNKEKQTKKKYRKEKGNRKVGGILHSKVSLTWLGVSLQSDTCKKKIPETEKHKE